MNIDALWVDMPNVIPESKAGKFAIEHYEVSKARSDFTLLRAVVAGGRDVAVPAGKYARLVQEGGFRRVVVMSDTKMEQQSNLSFVMNATGHVLVGGLGIGMVLVPVLRNKNVKSVLVVEKYQEVIDMVEKPLRDYLGMDSYDKLRVTQADILEWKPPKDVKWNTIYFDIWSNICVDNLKEITKLKRKFARRLDRSGTHWMGAWQENYLRRARRRGY